MRKLVPYCLVTLAMTVSACGDDEGAVVIGTPDAAGGATDAGEASTEVTSDSTAAPLPTLGDQSSSAPVATDAGTDSGSDSTFEPDAGSEPDSGVSSETTIDGGPATEGDGGETTDGGPVELTPCESACAAAASAGCEDNSQCKVEYCDAIYGAENCISEGDAYLTCVGNAAPTDFICDEIDQPAYTSGACDEEIYAWFYCSSTAE